MDSKIAILILGLMAIVLLISSEVSARDLTETSTNTKDDVVEKSDELKDAKYYGGGYNHGGGGGYNGGGGGYNHGGGGYNGGGGGYNHGGGGYNGGGGGYNHGGGYRGGGGHGGVSNNGN
ncbi:hypothetical protein KIW84_020905 [Lathyrus oleraceus]|uniref:Uncharacterized protein n=1 Tax=Pisum sativum TaxID=3888 RepID=A0A9D4Y6D3_PEA|nr:hypothetical protein KIW84_020905 [Pisum sativum]KAI5433826.1 hypothetical protein KIW84_020905 [Pisum sativum]KAI5433827.1 hypothetical protein KIW84_020905 [Pisum sativum]